jgi:hypothetical protein
MARFEKLKDPEYIAETLICEPVESAKQKLARYGIEEVKVIMLAEHQKDEAELRVIKCDIIDNVATLYVGSFLTRL